jgi:hypothetical protein
MKAFLNAQWVYDLSFGSDVVDFDVLARSTPVYTSSTEQMTALRHMNWNLISDVLLMESDPEEKARLVSPAKDPALVITVSSGNVVQYEAGFVMEHKNGVSVPWWDPFQRVLGLATF